MEGTEDNERAPDDGSLHDDTRRLVPERHRVVDDAVTRVRYRELAQSEIHFLRINIMSAGVGSKADQPLRPR